MLVLAPIFLAAEASVSGEIKRVKKEVRAIEDAKEYLVRMISNIEQRLAI